MPQVYRVNGRGFISWIVENLLLQRHEIRSKHSIEDDIYNDLLVLESKIEQLIREGILDSYEVDVINRVIEAQSLGKVAEDLGISKWLIGKQFHNACSKISFYLGGIYTDVGYAEYMQEKYNLTGEQIQRMIDYTQSLHRYRIKRVVDD